MKPLSNLKTAFPPVQIFFFIIISAEAGSVFSPFLKKDPGQTTGRNMSPVFQKIPVMGFQMYSNNKMLYSNFLLKYLPVS